MDRQTERRIDDPTDSAVLRQGTRWSTYLDRVAAVATVCACAAIVFAVMRPSTTAAPRTPASAAIRPLPTVPLSFDGAWVRGDQKARIAALIFSDFQCPFCAQFAKDVLTALDVEYLKTGKIRVGFRNFPLAALHPLALKAAEAAECAGGQGMFWQMHDSLFQNQHALGRPDLIERTTALGLNADEFTRCVDGSLTNKKVLADVALGNEVKVTGTPTVFLGEVTPDGRLKVVKRIDGAQPIATFRSALDLLIEGSAARVP